MYALKGVTVRNRFCRTLALLFVVAFNAAALGSTAVHLAPKMPMSLDLAPLPRTFFMHSVDFAYSGGRVILASNPDGAGNLHTNDELQIAVVHADGTTSWYRHDYAGDASKAPGETPAVDITGLVKPGLNRIQIRMRDLYGSRFAASDYYVVNFADGEAVPETITPKPYKPKAEAFIYAETAIFVNASPGPIDLCVLSPAGGEQATAQIELRGRSYREPIMVQLEAGFNRVPIPLGDLAPGAYVIGGAVKIGERTLKIEPHPVSKIAPLFTERETAETASELSARLKADQAKVMAGQDVRAAAADALLTRALLERIRRRSAAAPATETPADPSDIVARAKLILSCSRLVESEPMSRTTVDQLRALQGSYLDWGYLRYAKMAAAPGRVRYERGAVRLEGTYDNLAIYWANLPIAAVFRFMPLHSRKLEPVSTWPEAKWSGARQISVAGKPAFVSPVSFGAASVRTHTSRFDLEVDAPNEQAAIRLAEMALTEEPITPQAAESLFAALEPPVTVTGIQSLMNLVSQAGPLTPALKRSASLLAEGRFDDAVKAMQTAPPVSAAVIGCDGRRTLYALMTRTPPDKTPFVPGKGSAIACWSEGADRHYLLLQYDGEPGRREAAATVIAMLDLLPGRQMLVGDLHQHSNVSDGMGDPEEMFFQTVSHFTDFHALTDHNTTRGADAIAKALPSWGIDYPFLVGEEVTEDYAHIVAIDPAAEVDWRGEPMEVLKRIHDSGAVAILAHPWSTKFQEIFHKNPFARPEMNAFQYNGDWYADWKRKGTVPPMVEVTDTHDMSLAWPYRGIVLAEAATPAGIKQALLAGNCCAWTPTGPRGPEAITRIVWALMSDREYYEGQQLRRMAQRVMTLN